MFGKKKVTDEVSKAEDLEKKEDIKKVSDESYLDSLLDIMMEDHEDDSSSVVDDEAFIEESDDKFPELDLELPEDDEEEISQEEDSNVIDNIEEYIEQTEDEQNELMLDTEDDFHEELEPDDLKLDDDINHDEILQGLDEIVSGDDSHEDLLENIFAEPEEDEEEIQEKPESKTNVKNEEFILKDTEEKLLEEGPEKTGFIKSFFGKILKHSKETEEINEPGEIDYHSENKRLLNEMDEEDENNQEKGKKGKKGKKEKKEKKSKEGKTPKIKKAKDPEMEEKVKITPKVGFLLFSIIVVIVVAVLAGGSVLSYRQRLSDATDFFVTKNYSAAYEMVESSNLKKTDEEFYQQLRLIMYVHRYYESYLNFKEIGNEAKALDALVNGVGNYELYKEQGRDYNVLEEMQYSLGIVKEALQNDYNVTEVQAREMYLIVDRNIYSKKIYEIIDNMQ